MGIVRDFKLEGRLQNAKNNGSNIWVIGDVHGFFITFQKLVEKLQLKENDIVVMIGDLIDRGPRSAQVVNYVKTTKNFYCIRGNHEQMMIDGFKPNKIGFFNQRDLSSVSWYREGGNTTESSYIRQYKNNLDMVLSKASDDVDWMNNLPTEIVLDDWRFVHAGYDQNHDVEDQDESNHMWVREQFYTSRKPIDPNRTIIFGHTVTFIDLHKDDSKAGLVWSSEVILDDGRPMAIGIDTSLYHPKSNNPVLSAYNIKTNEVIYQNRITD